MKPRYNCRETPSLLDISQRPRIFRLERKKLDQSRFYMYRNKDKKYFDIEDTDI